MEVLFVWIEVDVPVRSKGVNNREEYGLEA
ncbi:hypothetical protein A2U01_0114988, partial [Trifolium medium]|nr:hypothetical protein [Trifolium medium]